MKHMMWNIRSQALWVETKILKLQIKTKLEEEKTHERKSELKVKQISATYFMSSSPNWVFEQLSVSIFSATSLLILFSAISADE